jgi:adenylate cyclase
MLGVYAFPRPVKWTVLVEKDEADAYLFITQMTESLLLWGLVGLGVAVAGAILLAVRISRPILEIARVTVEVTKGNFEARVGRGAELKDEVGDLARRVNDMTTGLNERFQLQKFVSGGTIDAIRLAKGAGIPLGGARVRATALFCDIRGYTAFADCHPPDVVVEVLNFFFQRLAEIVAENEGDIDKFVGDQIFAIFQGAGIERNAVRCALDMRRKMGELSRERSECDLTIGIGINTGEVTMGAMGSRQRMDYTVLGDPVNLAARVCSNSGRGQTLIGQGTYAGIVGSPEFTVKALAPMRIKGKKDNVLV